MQTEIDTNLDETLIQHIQIRHCFRGQITAMLSEIDTYLEKIQVQHNQTLHLFRGHSNLIQS